KFANDPAALRRFLNEAEITARLEHPGIVPVYGLVKDDHGRPCYAMRFIAGESLAEAIRRFHGQESAAREPVARESAAPESAAKAREWPGKKNTLACAADSRAAGSFESLPFRQLLQRFISVCQTVAYAHSKNVIHRDLKPVNVMLGPYGETLVVDWGLA